MVMEHDFRQKSFLPQEKVWGTFSLNNYFILLQTFTISKNERSESFIAINISLKAIVGERS